MVGSRGRDGRLPAQKDGPMLPFAGLRAADLSAAYDRRDRCRTRRAAYAAPAHARIYKRIFQCPVHFDQVGNELEFDAAWIDHPAVRPDPITSVMAGELCEHFLDGVNHDGGIVSDIRRALVEHPGQFPSIEEMAAGLSIHPARLLNAPGSDPTSQPA